MKEEKDPIKVAFGSNSCHLFTKQHKNMAHTLSWVTKTKFLVHMMVMLALPLVIYGHEELELAVSDSYPHHCAL